MRVNHIATVAALMLGMASLSPNAGRDIEAAQAQQETPVSYICTMDAEVLEAAPGNCPICKMTLQAVHIESAFACPVHGDVSLSDKEGICRIDKSRPLVPVVINHFFDCGEKPEHYYPSAGTCADGKPRLERRIIRAHGDHNPRHGGAFYMAEDKWHHLEGTYPEPGLFRIFFYDNFTKPLENKDVRNITGRASIVDANQREIRSAPLAIGRDGTTLETRFQGAGVPVTIVARVKFRDGRESPFEFPFKELSKEPPAGSLPPTAKPVPTAAAKPPAAAPTPAPVAAPAPAPAPPPPAPASVGVAPDTATPAQSLSRTEAEAIIQEMPNNSGELLKLLDIRANEIKTLVDEGNFGMVWVPTMLAKEVGLALGDHARELPAQRQAPLMDAVRRLVLSAWRLDQYGDLGDRAKITGAHDLFAAAVNDIKAAYANR